VTFTPASIGSLIGALTITDNSGGGSSSIQTVELNGTGTGTAATFSAASLSFGIQPTGSASAAKTETVTNAGVGSLNIFTIAVRGANAGDFAKSSDNCTGIAVPPNGTCTVSVTFSPAATGNRSATLAFSDNAAGSPQAVYLTGMGVSFPVLISPSALTFAGQAVGSISSSQAVTLNNLGSTAFGITGVSASGDFSQTNNCPASLGSGATCTIQAVFTPTMTGSRYGTLSIGFAGQSAAQTVSLTGTGNGPVSGIFTQRYDIGRTGQNTNEVSLTASNVTESQFGKLFSLPVDGQVYAQPLYEESVTIPNQGVHNVVFVATQHDSVYAFDADGQSTTPIWHVSFLNPSGGVTTVPTSDVGGPGYGDLTPEIGITSTPVIDPSSGTIYVTAKTKEAQNPSCTSSCTYNYFYRLHALDVTTGAEKFGGPVVISASVLGGGYDNVNGVVTFNPLQQLQRPGLLLLNGTLYLGFGSQNDWDPYHGWLIAYNATTLQQVAIFNVTPNGNRGAIWQGGGGIAADSSGNIWVVTANGSYDVNSGGVDYSDTVLKMQIQSGQFQVLDYFTPNDEITIAIDDLDLGSSPATILPDQPGPYPHLLATGGKDGRIWLLNRDNLGQFQTNDAGAVQIIPESDNLFGGGTYWNGNLYFQEVGDYLNQFPLQNGIAQTPTSSSLEIAFPNPQPVVSSNGTGSGVLWLVEADGFATSGPAILHAYDATDVSNEIYNSTQAANQRDQAGPAVKFVVPTVVNGKVYVGAAGEVDVYGVLPQ
jgi:hypothetical protein